MFNFLNVLIGVIFAAVLGWAVYGEASRSFGDLSLGVQCAVCAFVFMAVVVLGWFAFEPKRVL